MLMKIMIVFSGKNNNKLSRLLNSKLLAQRRPEGARAGDFLAAPVGFRAGRGSRDSNQAAAAVASAR